MSTKETIFTHTQLREFPKTIEIPEVDYLAHMMELQGKLMERYVEQGSLPRDFDLEKHESQQVVKSILFAFITEISELSLEYNQILLLVTQQPEPDPETLLNLLVNINEEIADCLHFLLELTIMANITASDINEYYRLCMVEENIESLYKSSNSFSTALAYARNSNLRDNTHVRNHRSTWRVQIPQQYKDSVTGMRSYTITAGQHLIDPSRAPLLMSRLWMITYAACNCARSLKNKPWKKTQTPLNIEEYQFNIMGLFVETLGLMDMLCAGEWDMYYNYCAKNSICHKRLDEKY